MRPEIIMVGLLALLAVAKWDLQASETNVLQVQSELAADLPAPYTPMVANQRLNLHGWKRPATSFKDISWPKNPGEAEICLWKDDKYAAASITIDDNWMPNHQWWLDICSNHDIRVTWFVVAGGMDGKNKRFNGTWQDYRKLVAAGHDVQSHTIEHFGPKDRAADEKYRQQYAGSIKLIETNIPGHRCLALAYPMGAGNHDIASEYFIAARGTHGAPSSSFGMDYMNTSVGNGSEDAINSILGRPVAGPKWMGNPAYRRGWIQPLYHGAHDMSKGAMPAAAANKTRAQIENLVKNRDLIWIDLYVKVAKYAQERDSATLRSISSDSSTIQLALTDLMRDDIFNQPLTIKVRLPDAWTTVKAIQGEAGIPASFVMHDGKPFALVEGIPDHGNITITAH